jgi:O-antigen/teichoic acid export membrane protein
MGQQLSASGWIGTVWRTGYRYGLSSLGPVAVSAAHFVASLLFLRLLKPSDFGQFSFLLIVVPFCLSATGALLGAPASMTRGKHPAVAKAELFALQKASLVVALLAAVVVAAMMLSTHPGPVTLLLFALYGASYTLRSFARSYANVHGRIGRVALSDMTYGVLLTAGLGGLAILGMLTMAAAALVLVLATLAAFVPFGTDFAVDLVRAAVAPAFAVYRPMWRDVTRWSLLGVVLTELASNCHAYLVTFLAGPGAFGLLALGSLFMRPAALVMGSLPDIDQPVMTRRIAAGDLKGAFRVVNEFRTAAGAVLAGTVLLAAVLVTWFPHVLKHYALHDVLVVLAFWIAITALRAIRTPECVFLMATGGYPRLARISAISSVVALVVTLVLLIGVGPIVSLGGVLAGEVVIVAMVFPLTNRWRARVGEAQLA